MTLPADPDKMNRLRARWADNALYGFRKDTGTDREDAVADLLCDLMHWCDFNDMDFENQMNKAVLNYAAETARGD